MRQVFFSAEGVVVEEVPAPLLRPEGVLVRVAHSLISTGTEKMSAETGSGSLLSRALKQPELVRKAIRKAAAEGIRSTVSAIRGKADELTATGYSAAGTVVEVGAEVTDLRPGQRVACAGAGYANHAELIYVPRNLAAPIPDGVSTAEAAFVTLGAIGMQGLRRARAEFGETVVVVGLGLIGQLVCQMLRAAGCRAMGVDLSRERVELAQKLGLPRGVVLGDGDPVEAAMDFTGGTGADAVVICASTGSSDPVNQAFQMIRDKGRVIVVGAVGMNLERGDLYHKEADFLISRSYGPGRYDSHYEEKGEDYPVGYVRWTENRNMEEFLRMTAEEKLTLKLLITGEYALDDAPGAYASLGSPGTLATLLRYEAPPAEAARPERVVRLPEKVAAVSGSVVRVGVIGAGSFTASVHLPNLSAIEAAAVRAVSTATPQKAKQLARRFGAAYAATDYREILGDPEVDAVLIGTRHNLHAPIAVEAASAGKHVFVEKPMAMTYEECREVAEAVEKSGIRLTVGFNRRFAPHSQKVKGLLEKKPGPKMLTYRVNAGFLPLDHWVYDPVEGGGRILGEGVHFFDLLCWFLGEEPVELQSYGLPDLPGKVPGRDNLLVSIRFADGSVGSLLYNTVGSGEAGKERIEIFAGGATAVIDDFKDLTLSGFGEKGRSLRAADKGHRSHMESFLNSLRGDEPPAIGVEDGVRATVCALRALESLASGRPVKIDWRSVCAAS